MTLNQLLAAILALLGCAAIGCGPGTGGVSSVTDAAGSAARYHVQREGSEVNGERTVDFVRDPVLGELSVQVAAAVPAADAADVLNCVLLAYGPDWLPMLESVESDGPSRWTVTAVDDRVAIFGGADSHGCSRPGYRALVVRDQGTMRVAQVEEFTPP